MRNVWFDLRPGTVTVVLGREGAGRTTLLRLVCGLVAPTSGTATLYGTAFADWANPAHVAGAVLDPDVLNPGRTGRAHLRSAARLAELPEQRVAEVVDMLGLTSHIDLPVRTYDRVLRLWLSLAHALLADPPVLLLDEPLRELSPQDRGTVRALLRTHADRGGTVLLTSGDLAEVDQTMDRALVLDEGGVAADSPVSSLTSAVSCRVRASDNTALAEGLSRAGARIHPDADGYLFVRLPPERVRELAAASGVDVIDLREGGRTLEQVLADLSGET